MIINHMNVKETFLNIFKKIFSDWKNICLIVFVLAAVILYFLYNNAKKRVSFLENEKTELIDTLEEYKNKAGELYIAKQTYITTIKDLKKLNEDLSAEVKKLKDNPIVVTKVEYQTKVETIYIKDSLEVVPDTLDYYKSHFNYSDRWANISGFTTFDMKYMNSYTTLNNIEFNGNFYFDLIEKNKKLYTAIRTDSPYIQINNIETAVISPEKSKVLKHYFNRPWGIMGGIGVSVVVVNNTVKVLPAVQLTVGYKFINF